MTLPWKSFDAVSWSNEIVARLLAPTVKVRLTAMKFGTDPCVENVSENAEPTPTFTDDGLRAAVQARRQVPGTAVLVLSQYVEQAYAEELLASGEGGVGYLLKDRVARLDQLVDALERVRGGGTVLDPEVVAQLFARRRRDPMDSLTPREREVLALMAEGRSNPAIASRLVVGEGAVEKHVGSIFTKLDLPPSGSDSRRVLAVLAWLRS